LKKAKEYADADSKDISIDTAISITPAHVERAKRELERETVKKSKDAKNTLRTLIMGIVIFGFATLASIFSRFIATPDAAPEGKDRLFVVLAIIGIAGGFICSLLNLIVFLFLRGGKKK